VVLGHASTALYRRLQHRWQGRRHRLPQQHLDLTDAQIVSDFEPAAPLPDRWRIADTLELKWRDWDEDEVVVFSRRLGHSLLLSAGAARILQLLADADPQALTRPELAGQLLACCAPGTTQAEITALLDATLPEFYRIGLIVPWGVATVETH
jgi:hypothetical protein